MVMGITYGWNAGVATSRPSMALSTEMAGVIMESPYRSAAPKSPTSPRTLRRRLVACSPGGLTRAVSAMIPPSPRLSAFRMKPRYLIEMTRTRLQKMSDSTPRMFGATASMPWVWWKLSRSA